MIGTRSIWPKPRSRNSNCFQVMAILVLFPVLICSPVPWLELTIGRYRHAGLFDLSAAVDRLPQLPIGLATDSERDRQSLRSTGTDHVRPVRSAEEVPKMVAGMVAGPTARTCEAVSTVENLTTENADQVEEPQPARIMRDCASLREHKKRRGGDSNPRYPFGQAGFQDQCNRPLCHPSSTGTLS